MLGNSLSWYQHTPIPVRLPQLPTPRGFHFPSLHALPLHTSMSKRGLRHVGSGLGGVCVHTLGRRLSSEMCRESFTFPSLLLIRSTTPMEVDTFEIHSPREWFRSHHLRFGHLSLSDHVHNLPFRQVVRSPKPTPIRHAKIHHLLAYSHRTGP